MDKPTLVGLTETAKKELESQVSVVTSIRDNYNYDQGVRSDKSEGYIITAVVIDGLYAGTEFKAKTDQLVDVAVGTRITIQVQKSAVYAKTTRDSTYATVELSLFGKVTKIGGNK